MRKQTTQRRRITNPDVLRIGDVLEILDDMDIYVAPDPEAGDKVKSILNAITGDLVRYDGYHGELRAVQEPLFKFMFMPLVPGDPFEEGDQIAKQIRFYTTRKGVNIILRNTEYLYNERD
jgi:hypothetical protein